MPASRWLPLRNHDNATRPADPFRLREWLAVNRALLAVYVLRDDLQALWRYRRVGYAQRFRRGWYARAMRSRIAPLKTFARRLRPYLPGVLVHVR